MEEQWPQEPRLGPRAETQDEFNARFQQRVERLMSDLHGPPKTNLSYEDACHAMQSGVAMEMERHLNNAHEPKHLRVGLNSALVNDAALLQLLIKKGLVTLDEYAEEVRLEMCREVDRYQSRLSTEIGSPITLR